MLLLSDIDTKSAPAVAAATQSAFKKMFPRTNMGLIDRLFFDVNLMFSGRFLDYEAGELPYHDIEHTLQVTLCFVHLLANRHATRALPRLTPRQFELGLAAALLHDSGYFKLRSDQQGTGAKFTHIHVLRSCAFAATYLPTISVSLNELAGVLGAIRSTGPKGGITGLSFNSATERLIGCALATADYLGQMSAPDYPDELEHLYNEIHEADEFTNIPPGQREYKSADDLLAHTPNFWHKTVFPKLRRDFQGIYRFLAQPYPDGPNSYLDAVKRNLNTISARVAGKKAAAASAKN